MVFSIQSVLLVLQEYYNHDVSQNCSDTLFEVFYNSNIRLCYLMLQVANGPGLAFNVFTEAIMLLPGSPFWAVLFFTILITLGVDGQFTLLESLLTVLFDSKHVAKIRKEIVVGMVTVFHFSSNTIFKYMLTSNRKGVTMWWQEMAAVMFSKFLLVTLDTDK